MRSKTIVVRTLGTAHVELGQAQIRPNAVRPFAALLYLSAEAGRRVPRRVLIDLLYPEKTERNGLHSLRQLLYQFKTAGVRFGSDQESIELPAPAIRSDYAEMLASERLTLEQIRAAQGGFLPGYVPHDSEAYKDWFEPFRAKTTFALSQVLLRDHARARDVGNLELSEAAARACLAISPLNELAVRALAETMALGGAKAEALRLLDEYRAEVEGASPELKLSAELMKRRIGERVPDHRAAGELPFHGRDAEMLEVRRRFEVSRLGSTECVVLIGEPGIGKTRLVTEAVALLALEGTRVERTTIQPHDRGRPMGIFVDLVPGLLQLPGALGIAPASMESLRRLTNGHTPHESFDTSLEPEIVSRAITRALDDLVSAITGESHLTIVIEDAQWCDDLSLRVLAELTVRRDRRLFILLTSREREFAALGDRFIEAANFVVLQPLSPLVSKELARSALRSTNGEAHSELHNWMAEVANGNPLFLSSLIAHFIATGAAFAVPPSLQELLVKRLDSLDTPATVILQTCVLLGSLATLERVISTLDLPYIDAVTGVARLDSLRILRSVDGKLLPSHALIAEALTQRSTELVLRMLHLRIASIFEAELAQTESPALLWNCAEHLVSAGEHARAFKFLRKCADHARDIGRPGAAAEILLRVAALQIDRETELMALRDAVGLAFSAREYDLTLRTVERIRYIEPAQQHDDIELAELHILSVTSRDSADYERRAQACVAARDATPEHRVRAGLSALQWADAHSRTEFGMSIASQLSDADLAQVNCGLALDYKLVFHAVFGDPLEAAAVARRICGIVESLPETRAAGMLINASRGLLHGGYADEAVCAAERAYGLALRCGATRLQMQAALLLAGILIDTGQRQRSVEWRERAQNAREANTNLIDEFELRTLEIDFCLAEANVEAARAALHAACQAGIFNSRIRRRWERCLNARLKQLSGDLLLTEEELSELVPGTSGVPSTGIRDLEIAVVCTALCAAGRTREAKAIADDFLVQRSIHSRAPLSSQLEQVLKATGLAG